MTLSRRVNALFGRVFPERQLTVRNPAGDTRFVRLAPLTQAAAAGGAALVVTWAVAASSVLAVDAANGRGASGHAALQQQVAALSAERDARAADAAAAQQRFSAALTQVSRMQSQLLSAEQRQRELETGLGSVRASLQSATAERDAARLAQADAVPADRSHEASVALDILSGELKTAAADKDQAERKAAEAERTATALAVEKNAIVARHDELFAQLHDAVEMSVKPLDEMFRQVGVDSDKLLATIDEGYSGEGGPLEPMSYSTRGNAAISESEARAQEVVVSLGKINNYRIAVSKLPLAMPIKSAFRFTSPFGARWGRMHAGVDLAGPIGTPIYATGDGVVTHAGWMRGYGNMIEIQHELGTATRYGHLSRIGVKAGQKVSRNSLIGAMGNTGRSTGSHLHYEVRVNGRAVNPMSFIKAAQNVF